MSCRALMDRYELGRHAVGGYIDYHVESLLCQYKYHAYVGRGMRRLSCFVPEQPLRERSPSAGSVVPGIPVLKWEDMPDSAAVRGQGGRRC